MTIKAIILSSEKARYIQDHCAEYGCELVEIGIAGKDMAKVIVRGDDEKIKGLFLKIGE